MDHWTVTIQKIEKRVDRYEKKAELKRLYKKDQRESSLRRNRQEFHQSSSAEQNNESKEHATHVAIPSGSQQHQHYHSRSSSVIGTESEPLISKTRSPRLFPSSLPMHAQSFIRLEMPELHLGFLPSRFYSFKNQTEEESSSDDEHKTE